MPLRQKNLVGQGIYSEHEEVSAVTKACWQHATKNKNKKQDKTLFTYYRDYHVLKYVL